MQRNFASTSSLSTSWQIIRSMPHSRCTCSGVNRSVGISRYSARIRLGKMSMVLIVTPADSCYGTASALMMRDERASFPAFTMQAMLTSPRRPHPYERALQPRCLTLTSSDLVRCNKLDTSPVAYAVLVARLFVLLQLRVDPCHILRV